MSSKTIASPWACNQCPFKMSHSEVLNLIQDFESKIKEWTLKQPIESWHEIIEKLELKLHPSHYLIFGLKKSIVTKLNLHPKDISLPLATMKLRFCQDILATIDKLDPGLTMQRAFVLKSMAETRSALVKLYSALNDEEMADKLAEQAVKEFKLASMCIKVPKSMQSA